MDNAKNAAKNAVENVQRLSWTTLVPLAVIIIGAFSYFFLQKKVLGLWVIIGGVVAYVVFNTPWFKNWRKRAKRNRVTDEKKRTDYKGVVETRFIERSRLPIIDKNFGKDKYFVEGKVTARLKPVAAVNRETGAKYRVEKELAPEGETSFKMEVSAETWNTLSEKTEVRLKVIRYLNLDEEEVEKDWRKIEPYVAIKQLLKAGTKKAKKAGTNTQTEAKAKAEAGS